jgi:predicted nucleic acid-binding protein
MGSLTERLKPYPLVGLDSAIFIYHFEQNPIYLPPTREIFTGIETGVRAGVTSSITLMEISVRPIALGQPIIARKYEALLVNFPHLDIVDLDRDIIRQAAHLRAKFRIRPQDALQVSASLLRGAKLFITNDRLLERLKDKLDVIILDDFKTIG